MFIKGVENFLENKTLEKNEKKENPYKNSHKNPFSPYE